MIGKRVVLLAVVALMVISVAPVAMADHCFRCRVVFNIMTCANVTSASIGGWPICWVEADGSCYTAGVPCQPHAAAIAPAEFEYTVASVERLDETRADETLVAAKIVAAQEDAP